MAKAACKVIINGTLAALVRSIETVLTVPSIHQDRIPQEERIALIQRLADVDLASYTGDRALLPAGGVAAILVDLERYGLVSDEVWIILRRPETASDLIHRAGA
jgi:hypothetical protein